MTDEIRPALDPDEWAEFLNPANDGYAPLMYHMMSDHHAAATALYGKPFGFTHADIALLRSMDALYVWAEELEQGGASLPARWRSERALLHSLIERVAALLPPAP